MKKYVLTDETKEISGHVLHRIKALTDISALVHAGDLGGYIESEANLSHEGFCWVHNDSAVLEQALVTDNATVCGSSYIDGHAVIRGSAFINGEVHVTDESFVEDRSAIYDDAVVSGDSVIAGGANICDSAHVHDIIIFGGRIYRNANVKGCFGKDRIYIYTNTRIGKNANVASIADFITLGPLGSRNSYTTFYKAKDNDIWVCCGCFNGPIKDFRAAVRRTHGKTFYAKQYYTASDLAEVSILR